MIYQERFTESEIQAVNTLIKECNWATGTEDYLVAYMKLLSDINPKFIKRRYKNRNPVAGYFAMPLERLDKILSGQNIASRKETKELVRRGLVSADGRTVQRADEKFDPEKTIITVEGKKILFAFC